MNKKIVGLVLVLSSVAALAHAEEPFEATCRATTAVVNEAGNTKAYHHDFKISGIAREAGTYIGERALVYGPARGAKTYRGELMGYPFVVSIYQAGIFGEALSHGYFIDLQVLAGGDIVQAQGATQRVIMIDGTHSVPTGDAAENRAHPQALFVMTKLPKVDGKKAEPFQVQCWMK